MYPMSEEPKAARSLSGLRRATPRRPATFSFNFDLQTNLIDLSPGPYIVYPGGATAASSFYGQCNLTPICKLHSTLCFP